MKLIMTLFAVCFLLSHLVAQVNISRQVISPFGLTGGDQIRISSTAGQPEFSMGQSESIILTQGFQQPEDIEPLLVDYQVAFPPCSNGSDGNIQIISISGCANNSYDIFWNGEPGGLTLSGVSAGEYLLEVTGPGFCSFSAVVKISPTIAQNCDLIFYNSIFPNGEPENQTWIIENITLPQFAENKVEIFNRWGQPVWSESNYNNTTVVFTGLTNKGLKLPDGTYYYHVETADNEFTGYIELLR